MTISYQRDVASSTAGGFTRLLFKWKARPVPINIWPYFVGFGGILVDFGCAEGLYGGFNRLLVKLKAWPVLFWRNIFVLHLVNNLESKSYCLQICNDFIKVHDHLSLFIY